MYGRSNRSRADALPIVYVPNTAQPGDDHFNGYIYPQIHQDGIVVDERDNGNGSVADYYIDILRRPLIADWAMRYGDDHKTPAASISRSNGRRSWSSPHLTVGFYILPLVV